MSVRIDLGDYRSDDTRVFAGRPRGNEVRKAANLEVIDKKNEPVEIHVPPDVIAVNSSFFLGMLGDTIRKLGELEFRRRYTFTGRDIRRVIEDGIREALRDQSPL